jgi:hypothetical protein
LLLSHFVKIYDNMNCHLYGELIYNKLIGTALLIVLLLLNMKHAKTSIFEELPDSLNGWTSENVILLNDKVSLYDYIDGGAELYISYGFKKAVSRKYIKQGQPEVIVEIFDMNTSENAFGVFSNTRYEEDSLFGQGSQYVEGALLFWKGKYYISVMTTEETDESKGLIYELGRIISERIRETGNRPDIIDLLPSEGLDKSSILYFYHYIWVNSFYFIADEDFLLIGDKTDAVLAKYGSQGNRSYVLIIQYDDNETAGKAYNNFIKEYFPEGEFRDISQLEDNKWMSVKLIDNTFYGVFNGITEEYVSALLSDIKLTYKKINIDYK